MKKIVMMIITLFGISSFAYSVEHKKLLSAETIKQKVEEVGAQITNDLIEKGIDEITFIVLMKGGICFGADLMREIKLPLQLEYIQTTSYGMNGKEKGELTIIGMENLDLQGKNVIVVDDVFDSGVTLYKVMQALATKKPASLQSVVLLDKKPCHQVTYQPDYSLFTIGDDFVVGYGMDCKEIGRNYPDILIID